MDVQKCYGKGVGVAGFSLLWDVLPKIIEGKPRLESKKKDFQTLEMIFDILKKYKNLKIFKWYRSAFKMKVEIQINNRDMLLLETSLV